MNSVDTVTRGLLSMKLVAALHHEMLLIPVISEVTFLSLTTGKLFILKFLL